MNQTLSTGSDTWTFFTLLKLDVEFLSSPAQSWNSSESYNAAADAVKHLVVVNDTAERALGMATSLHGTTLPKSEESLQARFKVVDAIRKIQGSLTKSSERVSKQTLSQFLKSSLNQM